MRNASGSVDYLHLSPLRALCTMCLPLLLVNIVQIFTITWTNTLYSQYAGQTYFTVTGYLGIVTTLYGNVISGVYTAAWVKIACHHGLYTKDVFSESLVNAMCSMLVTFAVCAPVFILFTGPVLKALSVPAELLEDTRAYYLLYLSTSLPMALAALLLTVLNGISSSRGIVIVNLVVFFVNYAAAALLLVVFQWKLVGAALCIALGNAFHLVFYWFWFRRHGYFRKVRQIRLKPELILSILRYSIPLIVQNVLCTVGYLLVSLQTNRLLSPEYITVLSVDMPLANILCAFGVAVMAFVTPNYAAGHSERLRSYMVWAVGGALLCGFLCCLAYITLGNWYYGKMFTDLQIVEYGKSYWFWRGIGFVPLSLIYTIRFFFDSVGLNRISLLSGLGELAGNGLCAFWLIPCFGNIGRSLAYPLGWAMGAGLLLAAYLLKRKRIYSSCSVQCVPK